MQQSWNPTVYAENGAFVPNLGAGVLEWLAPQPGERILDLGCGDGQLTAKIAAAGAQVTGVDASAEMIEGARSRGLHAQLCNAEALPFHAEFDAVFSNAACTGSAIRTICSPASNAHSSPQADSSQRWAAMATSPPFRSLSQPCSCATASPETSMPRR
jgi:SAM-dependent methyltransferase